MAKELDFNQVKGWLNSQPENTANTPYEIIITNAPKTGYTGVINRFVSIVSMEMSSGVTSIGNSAFKGCSRLTSINIPNIVTSIGSEAFNSCTSLKSVTIPEGVTSIGYGTFENCSSLTSITIPESVTSIGNYAFGRCSKLTSITIPESVTSIGNSAFSRCSSLTSINIPEGVATIESYAFEYCSNLTSINIPNIVTSIGYGIFKNCSSLTSITIPESVTSIGKYAFQDCSSLTSINISENVTSIGTNAFKGCSSLQYIDEYYLPTTSGKTFLCEQAPSDVTEFTIRNDCIGISGGVFQNRTGLTSITIPEGVTSIGSEAFNSCTSLKSVFMKPSFSETLMQPDSFSNTPETLTLYVPISKISEWQSVTLSNYGFAAGVKVGTLSTKKWIRIA